MKKVPNLMFKYKPILSALDLCRVLDIVENNRIFVPNVFELNDPMESTSVQISICDAGSGYAMECGMLHSDMESAHENYRIMSFTENADSPLMWAHYANGYQGCCLVFSTEDTFSNVIPVIYKDHVKEYDEEDIDEQGFDTIIEQSFSYKMKAWSYENEWRLIQKEEAGFLYFKPEDLKCVILGHNMNEEIKNTIVKLCRDKNIFCFKTKIMRAQSGIAFISHYDEEDVYETPDEIERRIKKDQPQNIYELFRQLNRRTFLKYHDQVR